jgi:hypothetical protein
MNYIIYPNERGGVSLVIPTGELAIEEVAAKDVPAGVPYKIVEDDELPQDHTFFDAWEYSDAAIVNMDKAKAIGHDMRRAMRAEEFKPHDEVIMKQIPGADAAEAEAARQAIREKYAEIQDAIDAATTTDTIKAALEVTP